MSRVTKPSVTSKIVKSKILDLLKNNQNVDYSDLSAEYSLQFNQIHRYLLECLDTYNSSQNTSSSSARPSPLPLSLSVKKFSLDCNHECLSLKTKKCHSHCSTLKTYKCHSHCTEKESFACHAHCPVVTTECHLHCSKMESTDCHPHCPNQSLECHDHCPKDESSKCHHHCLKDKTTECHHHCSREESSKCHDHCPRESLKCHRHCPRDKSSECHDHCPRDESSDCHHHCLWDKSSECHNHCPRDESSKCHQHCPRDESLDCHDHCPRESLECHDHCLRESAECHEHCSTIKTKDCHEHCKTEKSVSCHDHCPADDDLALHEHSPATDSTKRRNMPTAHLNSNNHSYISQSTMNNIEDWEMIGNNIHSPIGLESIHSNVRTSRTTLRNDNSSENTEAASQNQALQNDNVTNLNESSAHFSNISADPIGDHISDLSELPSDNISVEETTIAGFENHPDQDLIKHLTKFSYKNAPFDSKKLALKVCSDICVPLNLGLKYSHIGADYIYLSCVTAKKKEEKGRKQTNQQQLEGGQEEAAHVNELLQNSCEFIIRFKFSVNDEWKVDLQKSKLFHVAGCTSSAFHTEYLSKVCKLFLPEIQDEVDSGKPNRVVSLKIIGLMKERFPHLAAQVSMNQHLIAKKISYITSICKSNPSSVVEY